MMHEIHGIMLAMTPQMMHDAEHCGATRAAELLEVNRATVLRIINRGDLTPLPMDGERGPLIFRVEDVLALRDQRRAS